MKLKKTALSWLKVYLVLFSALILGAATHQRAATIDAILNGGAKTQASDTQPERASTYKPIPENVL